MTTLDPGHLPWFLRLRPRTEATGCPPSEPLTPEVSVFRKLPQAGPEMMPSLFLGIAYNLLANKDSAQWILNSAPSLRLCVSVCLCVLESSDVHRICPPEAGEKQISSISFGEMSDFPSILSPKSQLFTWLDWWTGLVNELGKGRVGCVCTCVCACARVCIV